MNKKGVEKEELSVIIIVFISFMLILALIVGLKEREKDQSMVELCHKTVSLSSKVSENIGSLKEIGIECPAPHYDIKENNKEDVYRHIINQLNDCWYKFLGNQNRIGAADSIVYFGKEYKDIVMVCSSFTVEESFRIKEDIDTKMIAEYLKQTDPKTKRPYYDYLDTGWKSNDLMHFFLEAKDLSDEKIKFVSLDKIKLSKDGENKYLVVFYRYNDERLNDDKNFETPQFDIEWSDTSHYFGVGPAKSFSTYNVAVIKEDNVFSMLPDYFYWQNEEEST